MQPLTQQFIVRAHYIHAIVGACQRFLGAILVPEPGLFAHGVQYLTRDAPSAESTAECLTASLFLKETIARGARDYHIRFHEWYAIAATCEFQPHEFGFAGRPEGEVAGDVLNEWADAYDRQFDRRHAWPPALRAAALLRAQIENDWYIEDLAAAVAVSRSTLERSFDRVYGISPQHYHGLLRLRMLVTTTRTDTACLQALALNVGYRSPKDAYKLFRHLTGMTLSAVRKLPDEEFSRLLDGPLALPTPIRCSAHA